MKRLPSLAPAAVFAAALLAASSVLACGEGAFNMGQGLRYQGYLAPRPAVLLIYADPTQARQEAMVYRGLQQAGHKVTVVSDRDALAQAVRAHRFDIAIADLDQIDAINTLLVQASLKPRLLPVVHRGARNAPALRGFNNMYLLDGASLGQYLKLINQLVRARTP